MKVNVEVFDLYLHLQMSAFRPNVDRWTKERGYSPSSIPRDVQESIDFESVVSVVFGGAGYVSAIVGDPLELVFPEGYPEDIRELFSWWVRRGIAAGMEARENPDLSRAFGIPLVNFPSASLGVDSDLPDGEDIDRLIWAVEESESEISDSDRDSGVA